MRIDVHVGVHKTATTFVQGVLRHNLPLLNAHGVGYLPMGQLRASLTRPLMTLDPATFDLAEHLDRFFPHGRPSELTGLVLSDENLIGDCQGFVRTGRPYERLEQRLGHLRALLAGHEVSLFCALRGYDSFPASAYCEGLRHGDFVPFRDFERRIDWEAFRWPRILRRMEKALKPERTAVWRLEDFRVHAESLVSDLAFGVPVELVTANERAERQSFSQDAVDALHAVAERLGPEVASSLVRPVSEALPRSPEHPAYTPWARGHVKGLQARYAEDCAAIPADRWLVRAAAPA